MTHTFSKKEAILAGWEATKKNFWLFAAVLLMMFAVSAISSSASKNLENAPLLAAIFSIAAAAISIIIQMGMIKITLKVVDGHKPVFDDVFSEIKLFWRYLGASIVYGLIILGGLILLIVPGIIWAIKYQYYRYLIIDRKMGIMESIRKSGEMTVGHKGNLFLFALILIGISILGWILFIVGSFFALPVVLVASAFVYRKLLGESPVNVVDTV